jgi:hypothetical protein
MDSADDESEQSSQPASTGEPLPETAAINESIPGETIESNGAVGFELEETDEIAKSEETVKNKPKINN